MCEAQQTAGTAPVARATALGTLPPPAAGAAGGKEAGHASAARCKAAGGRRRRAPTGGAGAAAAAQLLLRVQLLLLLVAPRGLGQADAAALAAAAAGAGEPQPPLTQSSVFRRVEPNSTAAAVLAPNVAVGGMPLAQAQAGSEVACSALCRAAANCTQFMYCGTQVGATSTHGSSLAFTPGVGYRPAISPLSHRCSPQGGCATGTGGTLAFQGCRLLGTGCTVVPEVLAAGPGVQVMSGFPARPLPLTVYGFTEVDGEGIAGVRCARPGLLPWRSMHAMPPRTPARCAPPAASTLLLLLPRTPTCRRRRL